MKIVKSVWQMFGTFLFLFALLYLIRNEAGLYDWSSGTLRPSTRELAVLVTTGLVTEALFQFVLEKKLAFAKV